MFLSLSTVETCYYVRKPGLRKQGIRDSRREIYGAYAWLEHFELTHSNDGGI